MMKRILTVTALLFVAVGAILAAVVTAAQPETAGAPTQVASTDKEKLQGEWRVTSLRANGEVADAAEFADVRCIFTKSKVKVTGDEYGVGVGVVTLRPDSDPKEIDVKGIKGVNAGKTAYGLYRFDGKNLILCIGEGDVRPSQFSGDDDAGLVVLERPSTKETLDATRAADATASRSAAKRATYIPHHYTATLNIRDSVDGKTYVTSVSFPVRAKDEPATLEVNSGGAGLSVTAQVTGEIGSEEAQFVVSRRHDGERSSSFPTITVSMGQIGRMYDGDRHNGFSMDVTLNLE